MLYMQLQIKNTQNSMHNKIFCFHTHNLKYKNKDNIICIQRYSAILCRLNIKPFFKNNFPLSAWGIYTRGSFISILIYYLRYSRPPCGISPLHLHLYIYDIILFTRYYLPQFDHPVFWPWHCLSVFDFLFLVTPLVSS